MSSALHHLLNALNAPAFQASLRGELVYQNEPMRKLTGSKGPNQSERTLFGLGLFSNQAEFRGFLRGFETVGPLQRIRLPTARLRDHNRSVLLNAVLHEADGERSVLGVMTSQDVSTRTVPKKGSKSNWNDLPYFQFTTTIDGRMLSANAMMQAFLQVKDQEQIGKFHLQDIDVDFADMNWRQAIIKVKKGGDHEYETQFRRPSGTILPVCVNVIRIEDNPEKQITLVAHDMSQLRRVENELRAAQLEVADLKRLRERDQLERSRNRSIGKRSATIISESPAYRPILHQIEQVGPTDSTVLITGETGTGKELVAKAIHTASRRKNEPFIVVNCGALPKDLIESELFGHQKGAFTGAVRDQVGRFKLADGGTLFLDEIGEMPLDLQTRLLRFLQEGEFSPIGSRDTIYANVRVVAATNRNLPEMIRGGEFRSDLFFRLNVFPIHNLPLRDRKEDIPLLLEHFLQKHSRRLNRDFDDYHPSVVAKLNKYDFPGNVRELENIVERAMILSPGRELVLDWNISSALPEQVISYEVTNENGASEEETIGQLLNGSDILPFEEMQRSYIEWVLEKTGGKVSGEGGAADLLGVKAQTLFSKMRKLGVKR